MLHLIQKTKMRDKGKVMRDEGKVKAHVAYDFK